MTTQSGSAPFPHLAVVGAGAWGTALTIAACRVPAAPARVSLWAFEREVAAEIASRRTNSAFLPGVEVPKAVHATNDIAEMAQADLCLVAVPAQHVRGICAHLAAHLAPTVPVVLCAKGVELTSGKLMTEVVRETCPRTGVAVLSGPTFAAEVAAGKPTAVTLACGDADLGRKLVGALGSTSLRPYHSDDVVGAQIGGAVKNVIAIACGIVEGRELGANARAALMTRGLAEMMRLGEAAGGRRETLMGLSGLGDLALTCNSLQSRNMSLGAALGRGRSVAEALSGQRSVVEGVPTAAAVHGLARRLGVEMPIVAAVNAILHEGADITRAIAALLERPFRAEH